MKFYFQIFPFSFCFSLEFFIFSFFHICVLPLYASFHSIIKSILGNDLGISTKDRNLKEDSYVLHFEEREGSPRVADAANISSAAITDLDEFQRYLHSVYVNRWPGSNLIFRKAVEIHKGSFHIPYPYEFYCTAMGEVPETLADVYKYFFYVWCSQTMNMIVTKSCESSSKKESDQNRKRTNEEQE